jgi:hypothetical protein
MNYKVQLSTNLVLKDKIEKQMIKKDKKITRVNQN